MNILAKTESICGKCGKVVSAEVFEREKRIFITSHCPKHGDVTSDHVWDDPEIYKGLKKIRLNSGKAMQVIVDTTKQCNLNCAICFARANEYKGNEFRKEDIDRLKDYRQIFLSGGEPTMREDLPDIIRHCVKNRQKPILFTNGIKLANLEYLKKLKKAGLRSVLLQLDTLKEEDSNYIRGKNLVKIKIKALRNLNKLNIPVSIWSVIVKGKNLKDLDSIYHFIFKFSNVKTVSAIPIWRIGRHNEADFVPPSQIIKKLSDIYGFEKEEFISTTQFVCNIDRVLSIFNRKRGKLFGICMLKGLVFENKNKYVTLGKIFNLQEINKRIERIFEGGNKTGHLLKFFGYFIEHEVLLNLLRNKHFRAVFFRTIWNLRYLILGRFLLINPFRFITVGIFPSAKNIDLEFIKNCNSYALSCDDYSLRPACLHYIAQDK